jgi:triosephosphate isomerase (TIM)
MANGKLIVGNWKMNGLMAQIQEVGLLTQQLSGKLTAQVKVVVCPPATLLGPLAQIIGGSGIELGGQDCSTYAKGAHTGDLASSMYADLGATYCIVGHSERRASYGESNALVSDKAAAAISAGLVPIICVGETEAQRDAGQTEVIVLDQVSGSIPDGCDPTQICVAYEPVWAIGTGKVPSLEDVAAIHHAIRGALMDRFGKAAGQGIAILYGGSVNGKNAKLLLDVLNVDGALVGGASLTAETFMEIITSQL